MPQTRQSILAVNGPKFTITYCEDTWKGMCSGSRDFFVFLDKFTTDNIPETVQHTDKVIMEDGQEMVAYRMAYLQQ